jgi:hypothetical protein
MNTCGPAWWPPLSTRMALFPLLYRFSHAWGRGGGGAAVHSQHQGQGDGLPCPAALTLQTMHSPGPGGLCLALQL